MTVKQIIKLIEEEITLQQNFLKLTSQNDPFKDRNCQYRIGAVHALKDLLKRIEEHAA